MAAKTPARRKPRPTRTPGLYKVDPSRIYPDGAWEVRYRDGYNGSRRKTFKTKQEALDFKASVRTDKNRGDFIDPRLAKTPFEVVAEDWYDKKVSDSRNGKPTPSTLAGYRIALDAHLIPAFGDRAINSIKSSEIEAFLTAHPR